MPVAFDPVGDFATVCDGLQAVTFASRVDEVGQSLDGALRRAVSTREAIASNGLYTTQDVRWHLPVEDVDGDPQPGDLVTEDDGTEWTILSVVRSTLGDRWACVCRNLVISERLDTLVTVQVATVTKGATGAHSESWANLQAGVRCRIQRLRASDASSLGTRQLERAFTAYMREPLVLDRKHRLVDSEGVIYRVTGYRNPERIDQLLEVDLELWAGDSA